LFFFADIKIDCLHSLQRNGMQCRLVYVCVNSATNASTACKGLVKIGPVTSVENSLESGYCAATRPQYDDRRHSARWRWKIGWNIAILISAR